MQFKERITISRINNTQTLYKVLPSSNKDNSAFELFSETTLDNRLLKRLLRRLSDEGFNYQNIDNAFKRLLDSDNPIKLANDFWEILAREIEKTPSLNPKLNTLIKKFETETSKKTPIFDLHEMRLETAKSFVLFIISTISEEQSLPWENITFITGSGNKSPKGAILTPNIEAMLNKLGVEFTNPNKGCIKVTTSETLKKTWPRILLSSTQKERTLRLPPSSKITDTHWNPEKQRGLDAFLRKRDSKKRSTEKRVHGGKNH